MKLYLIGGLGADYRVFEYLDLNCETTILDWIEPLKNEELSSYARRFVQHIDHNEEFGILGVSFGGIVAVELSKLIKPAILILISSVEASSQLPKSYVRFGKLGVLNMIPNFLIKPPSFLLGYIFGTNNKGLIQEIIRDTKFSFIRWALGQLVSWNHDGSSNEILRIHGTKDKLIPLIGHAIELKKAGHFMIVDRADEISAIINERIQDPRS